MARLNPSAGGYTPPPALDPRVQYEVRIDDAEFIKSRQKGTDGLRLTLSIVDGPDLPDGESPIGSKITDTMWLPSPDQKDGGKFLQSVVDRFYASFGLNPSEPLEDAAEVVGLEGKITIKNEEDAAGDPQSRINKFVVPKE